MEEWKGGTGEGLENRETSPLRCEAPRYAIIVGVMSAKLKVYLESSFVSYLTGGLTANAKIAADQAFTRQWWMEEMPKCDICASRFVVDESEDGCADAVARRMEVLKTIPVLRPDDSKVAELAKKLIEGHAVPENQATDALHIASAAVMGADVLLTWNCKHMANPHTLPKTREIVTAAGYVCPQVMTPKTFLDNLNLEAENA